jgi:two-component system phosphate regulon response regulator OmpR
MMLTARGDPIDRIVGIEMGADDYLPKPFEPRELAARLHALIRRQKMYYEGSAAESEETITFGLFSLDLGSRTLLREDTPVALTSGEFSLLRALARNPGRPLGRERLMALAAGKNGNRAEVVTERSVDVQILRLRRLIEDDISAPRYIQTVWGVGYLFAPHGCKT